MGNPLSKCCGQDTTVPSSGKPTATQANGTGTSTPDDSHITLKDNNEASSISKRVSTLISTTIFGPKRSMKEELKDFPLKLTEEQMEILLANEIPPDQIKGLSIGVDAGGMGVIHLAEYKGQKVAIKEASFNVVFKELEIYNRMKGCEGVVQFYGVTLPKGLKKVCIVTKYAEKGSLTWHLKVEYQLLTWADKLRLASQTTSAIARLHQEGIFHRDLHGGNILIDEQGNALLTDFGASTIMDERVVRNIKEYALEEVPGVEGRSKFISKKIPTLENQNASAKKSNIKVDDHDDPLIGVMAYIAPERFRNPKYFDAKCDIYSLGVLFWELTSGHSPFSKVPQDVHLAIAIMNGKRELPVDGTPAEYRELYEKCWQNDPSLRPSTDEILATLAKVRASMTPGELAVTRTRENTRFDSIQYYEESLSVPRPTSDIQQHFASQ